MAVEDRETLLEWREHLLEHGVRVSPVRERTHFKSIYFSDSDGLAFELATGGPGFAVDEGVPGSEHVDPRAGDR